MSEFENDLSERVGAAIRAAAEQVGASDDLHARIARDLHGSELRDRRRFRRAALFAAAGSAVAVVVAVVVISRGLNSPGGPSVADAAHVALSTPTLPAPRADAGDLRFVEASVAGVRFPNYGYDSSWRTIGGRVDTLDRRRSQSVMYVLASVRVGYTILDGSPLGQPPGARRFETSGTSVWVARLDGALVVTWRRSGHTCVLASRTATLPQLLRLVAWRGV